MAFVNTPLGIIPANKSSFVRSSSYTLCDFTTSKARSSLGKRITIAPAKAVAIRDVPSAGPQRKRTGSTIRGPVFVVGNNIDTDQIIPAEHLTLVPSNPEEYAKLGTFAMDGLPKDQYETRYVSPGDAKTKYPIIVAGDNFGCGSSREHAPVAIGAAGGQAVIAQSYARIFFRNCSATGELYPWEAPTSLVNHFRTGDVAEIDFDAGTVRNERTGDWFDLKPLGDVLPVIDAGGIFEYARQTGMISKRS